MKRELLAASLVAASLVACRADDGACGLHACDIRTPACQTMAAQAAACLLGQPARDIPVSLVSRTQLTADAVDEVSQSDVAAQQRRLDALALLYLADADVTPFDSARARSARVGAFYDGTTKGITIVTDGDRTLDGVFDVSVLVHEFTHALQDVEGRLAFPLADGDDSYDRFMARGALVEGEASLTESLATLILYNQARESVPWTPLFTRLHRLSALLGANTSVPLDLAYSYFSYPYGLSTLYRAYDLGGTLGVEGLWAAPPTSAREVMAGSLAPQLAPREMPVFAGLPDGYKLVEQDRLGAFVFRLFLIRCAAFARAPLERAEADELAANLTGDAFTYATSPGLTPLLIWRLRFATAAQANFASTYFSPLSPNWRVEQAERDVVITVTWQPTATAPAEPFAPSLRLWPRRTQCPPRADGFGALDAELSAPGDQ